MKEEVLTESTGSLIARILVNIVVAFCGDEEANGGAPVVDLGLGEYFEQELQFVMDSRRHKGGSAAIPDRPSNFACPKAVFRSAGGVVVEGIPLQDHLLELV